MEEKREEKVTSSLLISCYYWFHQVSFLGSPTPLKREEAGRSASAFLANLLCFRLIKEPLVS